MRALVAEDDATCRTVIEQTLAESGYEVIPAEDGDEAWDILRNPHAPRLVILGWHMPGLDGPEICRRVRSREEGQYVYILMIAAEDGDADIEEALEAGADDFVTKSVSMTELKARLLPARRFVKLCEEVFEFKESVRRQAPYDVLTGLDSRVTILDFLNKEIARAKRQENPLSVILVGIDHWASLNETYGRRTGDRVLCEVARRIAANVRPYDLVGRYGDEEFLVVTPGCDVGHAAELAERIRVSLAGQAIRARNKLVAITASLGVIDGMSSADGEQDGLLEAAEAGLRRARQAGGNRVEGVSTQMATAEPS